MTPTSLRGRTVVVTRAEDPGGPLGEALRRRKAEPVLRPVLAIRTGNDDGGLDRALEELADMDWIVFTSSRAVAALAERGTFDTPPPDRLRVAAVGPRTGDAIRDAGWPVDLQPDRAGAAGLLLALETQGVGRRTRVLFPASARARPLLADGLRARGARVDEIAVYEPVARPLDPADFEPSTPSGRWDALTFTSPSAVEALTGGLPADTLTSLRVLPAGVQGPTTGDAARAAGWSTVVEARPRTFAGLAEALAHHLGPA